MKLISGFDCCAGALVLPEAPLQPGTWVRGRYEVTGRLAVTKFNDVYRAHDHRAGLPSVLKHARCHALLGDTCCSQYAVLAHEHLMLQRFAARGLPVPQPLEQFLLAGRPCLAMRYVEGATLEQRRAQRRLSVDTAVRSIAQAAVLAHRVHRLGYVLQDLKPDNLMLTTAGVALLDLGAVHSITDGPSGGTVVFGTEEYMSPEQCRGQAVPRNDVYALGMCLHALVDRPSPRLAAIIERAVSPLAPYIERADLLAWKLRLLLAIDACSHLAGTCML